VYHHHSPCRESAIGRGWRETNAYASSSPRVWPASTTFRGGRGALQGGNHPKFKTEICGGACPKEHQQSTGTTWFEKKTSPGRESDATQYHRVRSVAPIRPGVPVPHAHPTFSYTTKREPSPHLPLPSSRVAADIATGGSTFCLRPSPFHRFRTASHTRRDVYRTLFTGSLK